MAGDGRSTGAGPLAVGEEQSLVQGRDRGRDRLRREREQAFLLRMGVVVGLDA